MRHIESTIPSARSPFVNVGRLLGLASMAGLLVMTAGCTTLPFAPKSGPGASLTLATAGYVAARESALREELSSSMLDRVEAAVLAAREADRSRLDEIARQIEETLDEIDALAIRIERNEENTLELTEVVMLRLDSVFAEAQALRQLTLDLESDLATMPHETLDRLRQAIGDHLDAMPPVAPSSAVRDRSSSPSPPARPTEPALLIREAASSAARDDRIR